MLVSKIEEFLKRFIRKDNKIFTVLINGKYGCGKTFNINNFFINYNANNEEEKKLNYVYLSLFGAKSVDQILLRLSEKIDSSYISCIDDHYFVTNLPEEQNYNEGIIILDDIDRKSESVSYNEIFGVISSLKLKGFKIIAILSDEYVKKEKKHEDYLKDLEKTFDRFFVVTGDMDKLNEVLDFDLEKKESIVRLANDNLRLIINTNHVMKEIKEETEKNEAKSILSSFRNQNLFFRSVLIALRCIYWNDDKKPTFEKDDSFGTNESKYNENVKQFDELKANALYYFFDSNDNVDKLEIADLYEDVKKIISFLSYGDITLLFEKIDNDILLSKPFDTEYFYLDDKGKEEYQKEFINKISNFDFSKESHMDVLKMLITDPICELSQFDITKIAKVIINSNSNGKILRYLESYCNMQDDKDEKERVKKFIDILKAEYINAEREKIKDLIEKIKINNDYKPIINYLYDMKNKVGADVIAIELSKNHFMLPDLSGIIDYNSWEYCHEIARFISSRNDDDLRNKFIDELICQRNNSNSKSLIKRCDGICRYNFGINFEAEYSKKNE